MRSQRPTIDQRQRQPRAQAAGCWARPALAAILASVLPLRYCTITWAVFGSSSAAALTRPGSASRRGPRSLKAALGHTANAGSSNRAGNSPQHRAQAWAGRHLIDREAVTLTPT